VNGVALEVRDQEWLRLHQDGRSTSAIAEEAGVSVQHVRRALARAREQDASRIQDDPRPTDLPMRDNGTPEGSPPEPAAVRTPWWLELVPLFPIGSLTPASECPHRGPIRPGSLFCCMVCSESGVDGHPAMKRDPATDPRPEPTAATQPDRGPREDAAASTGRETRRERRARRFAAARP
jgi:hypothetical protein